MYGKDNDKTNDKKSLTRNLFGQLVKLNNYVISNNSSQINELAPSENALEIDKNDQLISRSESENRIFVILAVICMINNFILAAFVKLSHDKFHLHLDLVPTEIPVQFNLPYLQAIFKNGSVFSLPYNNGTFNGSNHEFDLPNNLHYYLALQYDKKLSYIHGRGNQKTMSQTSQNLHGYMRHKKHRLIIKKGEEHQHYYEGFGFNNSISQIGKYLMFFGGGKNFEGPKHSK